MKELGLQQLLRYALPGGIGVAVLFLTYPELDCQIKQLDTGKEATLILAAVLLVGALIYNLHRALLFPPLFRFLSWRTLEPKPGTKNLYRPSLAELNVDRWRWKLGTKEERQRWDEWGAQTHFLYCVAWAIFAALAVGYFIAERVSLLCLKAFMILAVIMVVAGLVNNYRLLYTIAQEIRESSDIDKPLLGGTAMRTNSLPPPEDSP